MWASADPEEIRIRSGELLREADEGRLARSVRMGGEAGIVLRKVSVRWGLEEDEPRIAVLLELNGMPRWLAFEERFLVAEENGEVVAALGYRTGSKRMTLGLLVADPWRGERWLAVSLYAGAKRLARELCVSEVTARTARWSGGYAREAGYRRSLGGWSWRVECSDGETGEAGRRGRIASVLAALHLPARGAFRA
jgi:hypothetical protein